MAINGSCGYLESRVTKAQSLTSRQGFELSILALFRPLRHSAGPSRPASGLRLVMCEARVSVATHNLGMALILPPSLPPFISLSLCVGFARSLSLFLYIPLSVPPSFVLLLALSRKVYQQQSVHSDDMVCVRFSPVISSCFAGITLCL